MRLSHFMEDHHVVFLTKAAVVAAYDDFEGAGGSVTLPVVAMKNWNEAYVTYQKAAGATGTVTILVKSCLTLAAGGGTATAVPFHYRTLVAADTWSAWTAATSAGVVVGAGADQAIEIGILAEDLIDGDLGFLVLFTEGTNSPVSASVHVELVSARFAQSIPATVLT